MYRSQLILFVVAGWLVLIGCGSTAAPSSTDPASAPRQNPNVTSSELATILQQPDPPFLLDVRTLPESQAASIPGTDALIPVDQLAQRVNELDPNQEIIVYCRSGNRSGQALNILKQSGFTNVRHLAGGINTWQGQVVSGISPCVGC